MSSQNINPADRYLSIEGITIDLQRDRLIINGEPSALRAQSVRVLRILMENCDELVPRETLIRKIWQDRVVTDDSLAQCLVGIRRALAGFDRDLVITVPGRGYLLQGSLLKNNATVSSRIARAGMQRWLAASLVVFAVLAFTIASLEQRTGLRGAKPSIAVLPFADMTEVQDKQFLAEGFSEEILNQLATSSELQVMARTTSFSFGSHPTSIESISDRFAVTHVVAGSIRQASNRLRISVQLINTADSSNLWSQSYDRPLDDILDIQEDIAKSVANALQVSLRLRDREVSPDPFAHALVIQARSQLRLLNPASNQEAQQLLQQALEIEPDNVQALVVFAKAAFQDRGTGELETFHAAWQRSIEFTDKALSLAPDHPVAVAQRGWAELYYYQDFAAAARSFEQALKLDPTNTEVIRLATNATLVLDRPELGVQLGRYAVEQDPLCTLCHVFLVLTARFSGELELAEKTARQLLLINPDYPAAYELLGDVLLEKGDPAAALALLGEQDEDNLQTLEVRAVANLRLGRTDEFDRLRRKFLESPATDRYPAMAARLEAVAGNIDQAFMWLDKHVAKPRWTRGASYHHPFYDNLRADPRWEEYRRQFGLSSMQLARIDFSPTLPY